MDFLTVGINTEKYCIVVYNLIVWQLKGCLNFLHLRKINWKKDIDIFSSKWDKIYLKSKNENQLLEYGNC